MKNKIEISNIIMLVIVNLINVALIVTIWGDMDDYGEDEADAPFFESELSQASEPILVAPVPAQVPEQAPSLLDDTSPETGIINGDGVNIRQDPWMDSFVIGQIWERVEVGILDYDYNEDWVQISFGGSPAYVWREFLEVE